jgi:hypothetical protein
MVALKYLLLAAAAGFMLRPPKDGPPPGKKEGPPPAMSGGNETTEEKIEDKQERIEEKFAAGDCDCDQEVVDNCKALWEQKEAECEEHKEEWAGMCSAPQYTDPSTGELRDCQKGCCSEAGQETAMNATEEVVEEEEPTPEEIWEECSKDGKIGVPEAEACLEKEIPEFLGCLAKPMADCMTTAYGDGDGVITKDEFFAEFGTHMDDCFQKSIRKEDGSMALPCPGFEKDFAQHMAAGQKLLLQGKAAKQKTLFLHQMHSRVGHTAIVRTAQ